ncbi:hypothetical protein VTO73DRAFT_6061 [Trametes versicolor]
MLRYDPEGSFLLGIIAQEHLINYSFYYLIHRAVGPSRNFTPLPWASVLDIFLRKDKTFIFAITRREFQILRTRDTFTKNDGYMQLQPPS